jgi:hypothetical protein
MANEQKMTKAQMVSFPALYANDGLGEEQLALVKWFALDSGRLSFFASEANAVYADGSEKPLADVVKDGQKLGVDFEDVEFFGFVVSALGADCDELTYWRYSQLTRPAFGGKMNMVERDHGFSPATIAAIRANPERY